MKVYFAGSIRGGRTDAALYRRMIAHIRQNYIVLTEHVGEEQKVMLREGDWDRQIYLQDTAWLRECDILIAECTCPSLGVGYELAYGERLGKPCHILYRPDACSLSAMLTGDPYYRIHAYRTPEEAIRMIDAILDTATEEVENPPKGENGI